MKSVHSHRYKIVLLIYIESRGRVTARPGVFLLAGLATWIIDRTELDVGRGRCAHLHLRRGSGRFERAHAAGRRRGAGCHRVHLAGGHG